MTNYEPSQQAFKRIDVQPSAAPCGVSVSEHFIVVPSTRPEERWDCHGTPQHESESATQYEVRGSPGSPPIPVRERVDPVQPPHYVRRKVRGVIERPPVVHVPAHLIYESRYIGGSRGLVFAVGYEDTPRPVVAGIRRNPIECYRMELLEQFRVEPRRLLGRDRLLDEFNHTIKLAEGVDRLDIGDSGPFFFASATASFFQAWTGQADFVTRLSRRAARSMTSRVTSGFSMFALP